MAKLAELFGATLLGKQGEVDTGTALAGKKCVAIYFSAHWCPPCRGFTPKFADWYIKDLKAKGMEVIFVSSDRDEDAFKEYYGEQPWLSLPYSHRAKKDELSKKYKVEGIPSVVILGPEGELINKDGREALSGDPTGEDMPWKPKTFAEVFAEAKLVGAGGIEQKGSDLLGSTVLGLYFSAHWCPPCRGFTPQLAKWYTEDLKKKGLEIVFISSDRDEAAFQEYAAEQPWLALDFGERKRKEQLSNIFKVRGIPSLTIIDKDGSIITGDGRAALSDDPTGENFPWHPPPVVNLKSGPGKINEVTTVVGFCETNEAAIQKSIQASMEPLAMKLKEKAKTNGEDDPDVAFMIVTESGDISVQLRKMLGLPTLPQVGNGVPGLPPKLMIVDIPDEGGYYEGPEGDVTEAVLQQFVDDFTAKKLARKQLG